MFLNLRFGNAVLNLRFGNAVIQSSNLLIHVEILAPFKSSKSIVLKKPLGLAARVGVFVKSDHAICNLT